MKVKIICCHGSGSQTTQIVVKMYKVLKRTELLFCQLDLWFLHVLVAVAVVVCLRSLLGIPGISQEFELLNSRQISDKNSMERGYP